MRGRQWVARHAVHPGAEAVSTLARRAVGLTCRQASLLGIVEASALRTGKVHFNADLSQGMWRAKPMSLCQTVTPRGRIFVAELGRLMAPGEKLLVHFLPVHTLRLPDSFTDADIAALGGNTMHLLAVGTSVTLPGACRAPFS